MPGKLEKVPGGWYVLWGGKRMSKKPHKSKREAHAQLIALEINAK